MILSQVRELSEGKEWSYEAKRDGYLCLAGKNGGVTLWSHRGTLFTARLPEVARACEKLPLETVVDGEVVASDLTRMAVLRSTGFSITPQGRTSSSTPSACPSSGVVSCSRAARNASRLAGRGLEKVDYPVLFSRRFNAKPADP